MGNKKKTKRGIGNLIRSSDLVKQDTLTSENKEIVNDDLMKDELKHDELKHSHTAESIDFKREVLELNKAMEYNEKLSEDMSKNKEEMEKQNYSKLERDTKEKADLKLLHAMHKANELEKPQIDKPPRNRQKPKDDIEMRKSDYNAFEDPFHPKINLRKRSSDFENFKMHDLDIPAKKAHTNLNIKKTDNNVDKQFGEDYNAYPGIYSF
jgi:hypothetical protein